MFLIAGYFLLICLEIVTANAGRKKSVYQKDLSDICKKRIVSSVFLGSGVLETDSETLDFSKLELPYDCFVKVKAEPGSNIILVAQIETTDDLAATCDQRPNQFLVLDMMSTYGGYWEMLANDFSTPVYKQQRPKLVWNMQNYHTPEPTSKALNTESPTRSMPTEMARQKPMRTDKERTQTHTLDTTEITDTYTTTDENNFGYTNPIEDHEMFTEDDNKGFDDENVMFEKAIFEEKDDFLENVSEENDSKQDSEDTEEEETVEEMVRVPVSEPDSKVLTPSPHSHHYETWKPHIHFAPRYKNIISQKKEDSDFVKDDGSLDYLWRFKKPKKISTKLSRWRGYPTVIGYKAWQRQHGGQKPNKYFDYDDGEDNRKSTRFASSPKQYFFNADRERIRNTPDYKLLTLRTRLRYFQDSITKSMESTTKSKERLVTHKAPHFKLKSTTKNVTKLLRNKTLNISNDDLSNSMEAWNDDESFELLFVRNRNNQTNTKANHKLKGISKKINIPRNNTFQNKIAGRKGRKNITSAETVTSITTVSIKTLRPHQTQNITKTKMHAKSSMSTKMTPTKDIKHHVTVTSQKSALAAIPTKIMKHDTEGSSKITMTTMNEHDYLKYLLSNFRRKAKADDVPLTKENAANIRKHTLTNKKTTANITKSILTTGKIKSIETLKTKTTESKRTIKLSSFKKTTLKLTSPTHHIFNQTAAVPTATTVTSNISTGRTIATTKQDNFKLSNTTAIPTFQHEIFKTTLTRTSLLKTTTSISNITGTSNITTKDRTVSLGKPKEINSRTITTKTSLNITEKTNVKLPLNSTATFPRKSTPILPLKSTAILPLKSTETFPLKSTATLPLKSTATTQSVLVKSTTKSNISSQHNVSDNATVNVTIMKEAMTKVTVRTKEVSAHTYATSQTYQQETKTSQENNDSSTILTTIQSSPKINKDNITLSKPSDVVNDLDILKTTTEATQKEKEINTQNVIPLSVTSSTISISSAKIITLNNATPVTQEITRTTIHKIPSPVTKENGTLKNVALTTVQEIQELQEFKTTFKERDTKSPHAKMFVAASSTKRKSASVKFSGESSVTGNKSQHVNLFSAATWNKSTLAYKSWENLIQAAPDMISSLNRTKHLWKPKTKKAKAPKARKRVKRRLEYIPIEDSKPHTREAMFTTYKTTLPHAAGYMDFYLADDQKEEDFGRAHFGRLESHLGPVLYNICRTETKKTRLVSLFNTSNLIFIMNDFNLERLNLIITSATTIAQTRSQCPQNQLECQVSGVRVCIDMSSACDDIPNCGAYDIYDEDRILCGFNVIFKHSLVLTAVTFIVMISIGIYSVHYWLERCIPHVSEAFFVYTDTAENVLYLDTIMRSPNATDDFPAPKYHVPGFEEELRLRKRMVKRGLCSLLFRKLCPCCKMFKHTNEEAPISLEEFDRDHSDTGSHFDKMFQYSDGDIMDQYGTHQDDKATQTSFTLGAVDRGVSFHNRSKDSLIYKLGDLTSQSYHNEIELIKKMRDNTEIKKKGPTLSKEDSTSTPSVHTQRATAEEQELRNTVYDMGLTVPPVMLSEQEFIDQPEDEIEALAEPTKRLRFNEEEAGPSDTQQDNKARKAAIDSRRRTSVDLNKKKINSMFQKFLEQ